MSGTAPVRDINVSIPTRTLLFPILIGFFGISVFLLNIKTNIDLSPILTISGAIMNGVGAILLVTPNMPQGFPREYLQRLVPEAQNIQNARSWYNESSAGRPDSDVLDGFRYCHELSFGEIDGDLETVKKTSTGYKIEIQGGGSAGIPNTRSGAVRRLVMARLFDDGLHRAYTFSGVIWIASGVFVSILSI